MGTIEHVIDTFVYKTVDDHEILADVYRLPGDEVRPAILWLHGGALIFGTRKWLSNDQMQRYLSARYTVISVDYRFAPETKLEYIAEDLKDAYAWIRREAGTLRIEPNRIAIVGHSAGAYLTLLAGTIVEPRPKALVSFYGYGDLTGPWYSQPDPFYCQQPLVSRAEAVAAIGDSVVTSTIEEPTLDGRYRFYLYCRQNGLWPMEVCGHDPVDESDWFTGYEPLRNVDSTFPPTMLLHGEIDNDVPFEQSVLMERAIRNQGVECDFITGPNWGHMFDEEMDNPQVSAAFERVIRFINRHLL